MIAKGILLIYIPYAEEDPQSYYQNCRLFVETVGGFGVLLFRHPKIFGISEMDCRLAFYVITVCYSMGIAFFALEAFNAYELVSIKQPNAWTTTFSECVYGKSVLAARTLLTSCVVCGALLVILVSMYSESTSTWSCLGTFSSVTIDLWSPILLFNVCSALIATAFSYRNLLTFKYLPHYKESLEDYLSTVSLHRKNEVEKCQRNLAFTAIGPWLLVSYWQLLVISNDWVTHSLANCLAIAFSVLCGVCNSLQSIFTIPMEYSMLTWYAMKLLPASHSPKSDPVTMFTRKEVLKVFRIKGFSFPNPASLNYLPMSVRFQLQKKWRDAYLIIRNESRWKTKKGTCYVISMQTMDNFPFPMSLTSTIDASGNTMQVKVLKTPLRILMKKEEISASASADSCNRIEDSGNCLEGKWAMTEAEKARMRLQELAGAVWEMTLQNNDFMKCSKALEVS